MHILISNDDGYSARGIQALAKAMAKFGRVTVCAPEHNQSGASNSLTLQLPLRVTEVARDVYAVSGTPSDCVHLAFTGILNDRPDLVVSGINSGANMGDDTMYSGTVAAAIEGYQFGVDSIAFSQIDRGWMELESAAEVAQTVVEQFLNKKQSSDPEHALQRALRHQRDEAWPPSQRGSCCTGARPEGRAGVLAWTGRQAP